MYSLLENLLRRAQTSPLARAVLNYLFSAIIPFNRGHGFAVEKLSTTTVCVRVPYKKKNLNHVKGLHACTLATAAEFTSGVLLLTNFPASKFRLVLGRLEMNYHYQGKMHATARCAVTPEWIETNVLTPLATQDAVTVQLTTQITDDEGNILCDANLEWQIKNWRSVRTAV